MTKLANAPLQEAIFEIRWELDLEPSTNQQLDIRYPLAQGKLHDLIRPHFPKYMRKIPYGMPEIALQYQTVHQYWMGNNRWPVVQHGPGILTVNDTDLNYDWKNSFYPLIQQVLEWIRQAYDAQLTVNFASLRYIDSVELEAYGYEGRWYDFVQGHFNFSFANHFNTRGRLKGLQIGQFFELEDGSDLHVAMNNGKYRKTDKDALIWQTAVIKHSKFEKDTLLSWVERAHSVTSSLFREMVKPEFYDSFR